MAEESSSPLVLVTGASGYVAAHCVKQLLEEGKYKVRGTVRSLKNEGVCEALKSLVPDPKFPLELVEADLVDEESWKKAAAGCSYVLHIASPFPLENPKNADELIKPAVQGTMSVLKACKEVGGIKRVVLTSSVAAIWVGNLGKVLTEELWSDYKKSGAYEQSKLAAEKAAWDFVSELPEENKFELATINPGLIIGPLLLKKHCTSYEILRQMLERATPMVPEVNCLMIDVRDVARAHIIALAKPEAAGNRHILSITEDSLTFLDVARCLANEFNSKGYNVPTRKAPKPLLWLASWFKKDIRGIYPYVGTHFKANTSRLKDVLGIEPIAFEKSIVDMGHSVIDLGMIKAPQEAKQKCESKKEPNAESAKEGQKTESEKVGSEDVKKDETENEEKNPEEKSGENLEGKSGENAEERSAENVEGKSGENAEGKSGESSEENNEESKEKNEKDSSSPSDENEKEAN